MEADLKLNQEAGNVELKLGGRLSIQCAAELKTVLTRALDQSGTTILDLSDVDGYDLSAIQLLFAYHLASSQAGKSFILKGDCPALFRESVTMAGFSWADWLCFGNAVK